MNSSGVNTKRIAKNTAFLYIRMLFIMAVTLFTSRVLFRSLGEVDFGLNNVIAGVIVVFSYLNNSLAAASSRFITYELGKGDLDKLKTVFTTSFSIHFFFAIVVLLVGEIAGIWIVNNTLSIPDNRIFACNCSYQFVVFSAIATMLQVPFNALIISHERMHVYAYIGIFDAVARCAIAYAIWITGYDKLITLGVLQLLLSIILSLFYFIYCKKNFPDICKISLKFDKANIKSMLTYSTWSLIGSTANMLKNQGVNLVLNIFFGSVINAANAIAYQVCHAVTNFTNNFTMAMNPQIIKSYAAKEYDQMKQLIFRGGKFSFYLLMFLCLPIIFETDYILKLWMGKVPEYTVLFTRLVLILSMVEVFTYTIGCAVQATGKIKNYQLVISGVNMLNFPVSFILFKFGFPPYAALSASIIISITTVLMRLYFIKSLLSISPQEYFQKVLVKSVFISAICFITPYFTYINMEQGIQRLFVLCFATWLTSSVIIYVVGLDSDERKSVRQILSKIKTKVTHA